MQAIEFKLSLPRVLATMLLGKRFPWLIHGPLGPLRFRALAEPALRGPDWALLRPRLAGICGTDLGVLDASVSPSASPYSSFPAVFGHEIVADVVTAGDGVAVPAGTRVVVDPSIRCEMRGLDACPACARGFPYLCRNVTEGALAPGLITGFCRDLPGGWGTAVLAHRSQLHVVPDAIPDELAVMIEPLSIAIHAVLRRPPQPGEALLILGGGSIGLCTVAAIRLLGFDNPITITAKYEHQQRLARALGADRVITPGQLDQAMLERGARKAKPLIGREVYRGGFDVVFDCVGSRRTLVDALRCAREGGQVTLIGGAGEISRLDWTFVWMRELTVTGSAGYGQETWQGRTMHTFEIALEALAKQPDHPLAQCVTHRFPLTAFRQAIRTAMQRGPTGALKVVFDHRA